MTKEYTKVRQVYAWIGFLVLVVVSAAILAYTVHWCVTVDQADKVQLEQIINSNLA